MSSWLAILLVAVLFAAFALLTRRVEPRTCSSHGCPDEAADACAGCDLATLPTEKKADA